MRTLDRIDRHEIEPLLSGDEFFWLDAVGPTAAQIDELAALLHWNPLAVEDVKEFGQRPKLDDYRTHALLVFYGLHEPDGTPSEVHMFVSGGWVVTVRRTPCLHLDRRRERVHDEPPKTEIDVVYRIVDALADSFFPVLEQLEDHLERLEDEIVSAPSDAHLNKVLQMRRRLGPMRRVAEDQDAMFADVRGVLEHMPGLEYSDDAEDAFRDIADHLHRINDTVTGLRDRVRDSLGLYASTNSNRLNEVITKLTVLSTIFLPLTFVVGFFGQNFGWMVGHIDSFASFMVWGVGGSILPLIVIVFAFRRSGLIGRRRVESATPE